MHEGSEPFRSDCITPALLDRLTHHCEIIEPATKAGASSTAPEPPYRPGLTRWANRPLPLYIS